MSNSLKRLLGDDDDTSHESLSPNTYADFSNDWLGGFDFQNDTAHSLVGDIQQANSLPNLFAHILLDPNVDNQMSLENINEQCYGLEGALTDWSFGTTTPASDTVASSLFQTFSSRQVSDSPAITTASSQYTPEPAAADYACFGTLRNIEVKLVGNMQEIHDKLATSTHIYASLHIKAQAQHVVVCFADDEKLGYLRSSTAKSFAALLAIPNIQLEPLLQVSKLKDIIGQAGKSSDAHDDMEVNVYGMQIASAKVGRTLANGKLWLQKPNHHRLHTEYKNPHFLTLNIEGLEMPNVDRTNQLASSDNHTHQGRREDQLRKMVEKVYQSLRNNRHLDRIEGGDRVSQRLLNHQQEALGFLLERESGHIDENYRLWKRITLESGKEIYRHRITNAKRDICPDERGGGILADEMGMGKSLSILALIMKTLDIGQEWANQKTEESEGRAAPKYSRSTLVVVSSALLINNWENEIKIHLKRGGVVTIKYHGPNRIKDLQILQDSDIVITTYNTLAYEFQNMKDSSVLHRIGWYRVVLDEGHMIRRRGTTFFQSCDKLEAHSRWCLTGTPIQNKLSDLGALFAFIRVEPFSKQQVFRRWIEMPFEQQDASPDTIKDRLVILLEAFCLRRTKDIINLPDLKQTIRTLEFSPPERQQYENTKRILMRMIKQRVGATQKCSTFGLFQAHMQMRIFCNHGTYQKQFSWQHGNHQEECEAIVSELSQNTEITCSGCQQPMPILGSSRVRSPFIEQCHHVLCSECLDESVTWGVDTEPQHCPICIQRQRQPQPQPRAKRSRKRRLLSDNQNPSTATNSVLKDSYFHHDGYSTKMRAVIEDVQQDLTKTKSIIFSCWTRTLHLLAKHLDAADITYFRIDGNCPLPERQEKLDQFAKDTTVRVLIMTTGTGAFGLNLTCANRVFIVELQWNPAVESQAIARAIRLGQESDVSVTRYIIKNTVEEEMQSQQERKKYLASMGFGEQPESMGVDD